ncbi:MAG TPA: glycosyltransferase family 2 protein [Candidatus Limiplasma sp.]|nr:glycosyltransferase family 2 protein [Candidatus Limiplasma sp.]HRX07860.1 glycosyltransferase family 2 protein [Candidatus Limiplasma sp.]
MTAPLFSIIVPIYKVEKYLKQCVDSILSQNYSDYELILVDDGSPDSCPQICDAYARENERVKVVHKENGGLVSARKAGCQAASGRYILNVDGDDWVAEGYFAPIEAAILAHQPDVVCFGFLYQWGTESRHEPLPHRAGLYVKQEIRDTLVPILIESARGEIFSPTVWTKAVKRELYTGSQMTVDNRISIGEDGACTKPIIYRAESLYILPDCLYHYRQNEQSMTKNKKAFSLKAPALIAAHYQAEIPADQDMQQQISRNFAHNIFIAATSQYNRSDSIATINADIRQHLEEDAATAMIRQCRFSLLFWKGTMVAICLKHKLFFLMRLYWRLFK